MSSTIALDAMGGDHAPDVVVAGAAMALENHPDLHFILCGDRARIEPLLERRQALAACTELVHTEDYVASDARPSTALRHGRNSSMRLAINAVKSGDASAAVSAGNTGGLMAIAKFVLKTLPGIDRPAIATLWPTRRGHTVMLDLGANAECDVDNLVQFAIMGEVYARAVLGVKKPTVGLLNIGTEEMKGGDTVRGAAAILRDSDLPFEFHGFIEGTDILAGTVDVVVTDGFTGNVALKVAEGAVNFFGRLLRDAFRSSLRSRMGYMLARPALDGLKRRIDPRRHNGAMFLGLNGIVVKSHGGTDALGYAYAIAVAADLVSGGTNEQIIDELSHLADQSSIDGEAAAS